MTDTPTNDDSDKIIVKNGMSCTGKLRNGSVITFMPHTEGVGGAIWKFNYKGRKESIAFSDEAMDYMEAIREIYKKLGPEDFKKWLEDQSSS